MKKIALSLSLFVAACGYSSQQNDLSGQVKKVISRTPIICPDYTEVDISLGFLKNGVGSISKEDVILYVPNAADVALLKGAADSGDIVKVTYDVERVVICHPDHEITSVKLVK